MKKTFGVLLILLAAFLSLILFALFINIVLNNGSNIRENDAAHKIDYLIGSFLVFALFATLNFVLYFFGIKLLKSKRKELIPISDEDFPSQLRR